MCDLDATPTAKMEKKERKITFFFLGIGKKNTHLSDMLTESRISAKISHGRN